MWLPQARWMVNFMENPPRKNGWELGVPHDLGKLHMGFNGSSYGMIGQNAIKYLAVHFKTVASYGCSSPFFLVKSTFFYGFSTISNHQLHQNPPCFPKKNFRDLMKSTIFSRWSMVQSLCSILFLWFFYHFSTPQPTGRDARARPARAPRARTPLPLFFPRANSPMNCDWSGQVSMAKPSWEWEHGGNMVGPQFSRPTTWLIQYD